jgi:peptidoglycan/xylan/chitin deacetylase (PgdA/CDA1 family)
MLKILVKRIVYNKILSHNIILPYAKEIRVIFAFHDVSDPSEPTHNGAYSTPVTTFKKNIEWIKANFNIISIDSINNPELPKMQKRHYAAITFDDGFHSVLTTIHPYFRNYNIPYSVFINKQAIKENWLWCSNVYFAKKENNKEYLSRLYENFIPIDNVSYEQFLFDPVTHLTASNKLTDDYSLFQEVRYQNIKTYLNENELKQLVNENVTIGNHTLGHKQLSSCSEIMAKREIEGNKNYLEDLLQKKIEHFAIPFGFMTTYNDSTISIAKELHHYVYSTKRSFFKPQHNEKTIPRISLMNEENKQIISYLNFPFVREVKM